MSMLPTLSHWCLKQLALWVSSTCFTVILRPKVSSQHVPLCVDQMFWQWIQNRATNQLSVTVRDHQFYQKLSHKEGQGKFQKPHFHFTSLPNFIRKGPSVVCWSLHITALSIRKGTKKYPFQSTQFHNLLLANIVSQSSEKLRNRQSPKSKCILLSCSPAGGGGGACGGGGGGGQRGRGGKGQLPPLLQLSFLAQK